MQAVPNLPRKISFAFLFLTAAMFVSCAKDKDPRLVNDPNAKFESTIPWNKQEKWETQGDPGMANMMQGR